MIRSLICFLLFSIIATSQTAPFEVSSENFPNQERGFYYHTSTSSNNYELLTTSELSELRPQGMTLLLRVFYMPDFKQSAISQSYLNNMQIDFNRIRNAGLKVIVRFAYSGSGTSGNYDANKNNILAHIQQLQQVIFNNRDVIACFQAGFIGKYGEWYYSTNFGTSNLSTQNIADRQEVLNSIVVNFGIACNLFVQVRTPKIKQLQVGNLPIQESEAYNMSIKSRIGAHDDAFANGTDDQGTFLTTADYNYWVADNQYAPMGGESNAVTSLTSCANSVIRLNQLSVDYLNSTYFPQVLSNWTAQGCLEDIKKKLGYRFELIESYKTASDVTVKLRNVGFGHLYNQRYVFLVYKNEASGAEFPVQVNTDCRKWFKNTVVTFTSPIPTLPSGYYQVYLSMPDVLLPANPLYSVRFANTNIWNSTLGYNDLSIRFEATTLSVAQNLVSENVLFSNGYLTIDRDFRSFKVYDMIGQLVKSGSDRITDLSDLSNGVYIIKIDHYKPFKILK